MTILVIFLSENLISVHIWPWVSDLIMVENGEL